MDIYLYLCVKNVDILKCTEMKENTSMIMLSLAEKTYCTELRLEYDYGILNVRRIGKNIWNNPR